MSMSDPCSLWEPVPKYWKRGPTNQEFSYLRAFFDIIFYSIQHFVHIFDLSLTLLFGWSTAKWVDRSKRFGSNWIYTAGLYAWYHNLKYQTNKFDPKEPYYKLRNVYFKSYLRWEGTFWLLRPFLLPWKILQELRFLSRFFAGETSIDDQRLFLQNDYHVFGNPFPNGFPTFRYLIRMWQAIIGSCFGNEICSIFLINYNHLCGNYKLHETFDAKCIDNLLYGICMQVPHFQLSDIILAASNFYKDSDFIHEIDYADKGEFARRCVLAGIPHVPSYAVIQKDGTIEYREVDIPELPNRDLFTKPSIGTCGDGYYLRWFFDPTTKKYTNRKYNKVLTKAELLVQLQEFSKEQKLPTVIQPLVRSSLKSMPFIGTPDTCCDLRIHTWLFPNGDVKIWGPCNLRYAVHDSETSNISQLGDDIIAITFRNDGVIYRTFWIPDTCLVDKKLIGQKFGNWDKVVEVAVQVSKEFKEKSFWGMDIIISDEFGVIANEINGRPGCIIGDCEFDDKVYKLAFDYFVERIKKSITYPDYDAKHKHNMIYPNSLFLSRPFYGRDRLKRNLLYPWERPLFMPQKKHL